MSVHEPTPFRAAIPSVDADRAMNFGVGVAAAPLWATFFTAASAGMAYWWMTSAWTRHEAKAFAPPKAVALAAVRAPAPAQTAEPAPRRPEPAPVVEASPAPLAPMSETVAAETHSAETLAVATPLAASLEPAAAPAEIATVVEAAKPAPHVNGAGPQASATASSKPPVRRRPGPKA